jgi:hypothetical protein
MSTGKGKERAFSPTGNTIITTAVPTVLQKDIYSKVKIPDAFTDDRKKFKVYETQCRIYL